MLFVVPDLRLGNEWLRDVLGVLVLEQLDSVDRVLRLLIDELIVLLDDFLLGFFVFGFRLLTSLLFFFEWLH